MNTSPETGYQMVTQPGGPSVRLSAYQPTSELVAALERAEWHGANRRWHNAMLSILRAIASLLAEHADQDAAGAGPMTESQIAGRARCDERTVRRWMPVLVRLQLIGWAPGAPAIGAYGSRPGQVRVNKRRVIWLTSRARVLKDAARLRIRAQVADRMRAIRDAHAFWVSRLWRRNRPDTKSAPPPQRGDRTTRAGTPPGAWDTCEHDGVPGKCPSCRRRSGAGSARAQTMEGVPWP